MVDPVSLERVKQIVSRHVGYGGGRVGYDNPTHDDIAREILAALQPEGPPAMGVEEAARIIDPDVFTRWGQLYDYCKGRGDTEEEARETADWMHGALCQIARTKARAILAPARGEEGVG